MNTASKRIRFLNQIFPNPKPPQNPNYSSSSYRKRITKRNTIASNQTLKAQLTPQIYQSINELPPRFTPSDLTNSITHQSNPLICLHLFNHASKTPRFTHTPSTFHITFKKLGSAKMYPEFDTLVNELLSLPFGSETLFNTIIYFYTQARMLSKAISIYKHMRNVNVKPSIRTYNLLFAAFLSSRSNTYINRVYMDTITMLFKQMVNDGIEPDIFSLNSVIKGYVISLHVNDALRVYHQMGVVYECRPNSFTFDYLIHGLCAQGRTCNAGNICGEMKGKGFVPSGKSYNSLVCAFAMEGDVDGAVRWFWEMVENERVGDYVTVWTLVDEFCKRKKFGEGLSLVDELLEKRLVDRRTYKKIQYELRVKYGNIKDHNGRPS